MKGKSLKKSLVILLGIMVAIAGLTSCGKNEEKTLDLNEYISVVSREEGSGTRGAFVELFGVEGTDEKGQKYDNVTVEASITNNTAVMMNSVASNPYAIGYISLGSLNDTVKAVKIDGVEPTAENIKNGSYKVARPFNIATKGKIDVATKDFINFIMSAEGQQVIAETGYISESNREVYEKSPVKGKVVVAGSSSVAPVMEKLKEAYEALNPQVRIEIQQSDSTTGMTAVADGICHIGMASRDLKASEIEDGLKAICIAMDGIVVIINNQFIVEELSSEQVHKIFVGDVTRWSEVL